MSRPMRKRSNYRCYYNKNGALRVIWVTHGYNGLWKIRYGGQGSVYEQALPNTFTDEASAINYLDNVFLKHKQRPDPTLARVTINRYILWKRSKDVNT